MGIYHNIWVKDVGENYLGTVWPHYRVLFFILKAMKQFEGCKAVVVHDWIWVFENVMLTTV